MSLTIEMYDEAVKDYFKEIFPNTVYAPTDMALKVSAEGADGSFEKAKLPLISVFRTPTLQIGNITNDPAFRRGHRGRANIEAGTIQRIQTLPIDLEYQIDVWGRGVAETNALFAELLFHMKEYPAFEVSSTLLDHKTSHVLHIMEVSDGTDLLEEEDRGRFGRMTIIANVEALIMRTLVGPMATKFAVDIDLE